MDTAPELEEDLRLIPLLDFDRARIFFVGDVSDFADNILAATGINEPSYEAEDPAIEKEVICPCANGTSAMTHSSSMDAQSRL